MEGVAFLVCVMVASSKLFKTYKSCARDGGAGNFPAQPVGPESKAVWVWGSVQSGCRDAENIGP